MRRAKSGKGRSARKSSAVMKKVTARRGARRGAPKSLEEYAAGVPEPAKRKLREMRAAIRMAVPREAVEVISYKIPAFKHEKILVWYAAFTKHVSLFPTAAVIKAFQKELKGYSVSKGTIQFPLDRRLPVALVKKIVKARVAAMQK
ncbi:MAG TPA: DUF1801 domain-containing protein [Candidatus Solibacter sp.]|nr:DUF1801 domain-containing protein [Candidatus Solibacter sp.]